MGSLEGFVVLDCFSRPRTAVPRYIGYSKRAESMISTYRFCEYISEIIPRDVGMADSQSVNDQPTDLRHN